MAKISSLAWGQIVAKAWIDQDFSARLLAQPAVTLRAEGLDVGEDVVVAHADVELTGNDANVLRLPLQPRGLEANEAASPAALDGSYCYCGVTISDEAAVKRDGSYCYCGVTVSEAAM